MNTVRCCLVIAVLAGVALAVIGLRSAQTRRAAELLQLESRRVELRRQWWALQTRTARLRSPRRVYDRVVQADLNLYPPGSVVGVDGRFSLVDSRSVHTPGSRFRSSELHHPLPSFGHQE